jgi:hypothetical protein
MIAASTFDVSAFDLADTHLSGGETQLSIFGSVGVGDGVLRPSLFDKSSGGRISDA